MYQRITLNDFVNAFWREGLEGQFSRPAKDALFAHLEGLESVMGEQIEINVAALCSDYKESNVEEIIKTHGLDTSGCNTAADRRGLVEEFLRRNTDVIWSNGDEFLFWNF